MKNFAKIIVVLFFVSMLFQGCNSGGCIRVGGAYQGVSGDIEYCFDKKSTEESGTPAVSDGSGKTFFGFSEDDIKKILEKISPQEKITSASANESAVKRLKRELAR